MNIRILEQARTILSNPDSHHNYFGWPSIARLQNGRLAVVCSGYRCGHIDPFGKMALAVSENDGRTYTGAYPVIDTPLDDRDGGIATFGENGVIVTSFNNTVLAQRNWNPVSDELNEYYFKRNTYYQAYLDTVTQAEEDAYIGATFKLSRDGGETFGELHRSPVTSPHGPTALADGTLLWVGRTFSADDSFGDADGIHAYTVDANGQMTYLGAVPAVVKNGVRVDLCEPHAIELDDGRILCHIRGERNGFFTLFQSISADGGRTWSEPEQLLADRGGAPAHLYEHSDGVLISAYGYRESPDWGIRVMLCADQGRTWEKDLVLYQGCDSDLGYPCTVELDDGSLLTVFYAHDSVSGPAVIKQVRWEIV